MDAPTVVNLLLLGGTLGMGIYGAYLGGIRQMGSVAAFLLAYLGAKLFAGQLTQMLDWPSYLSYLIVFCTIFIVVIILARVLKLTVKMLMLGPIDRLLGLIIGCIKWLLGASLFINLLWLCGAHPVWLDGTIPQWVGQFVTRLFGIINLQ